MYKGDRTETTPPTGGTATTVLSNARGKTTELWQHDTTGGHTTTTYGYDRAGQLTGVTDPATSQWLYEYDLLGRKTKSTDPDAGVATTSFDNAGQITSTTDGRGQQLWHEYDNLGRKTRTRADTVSGTILSSSVYDTIAKGQLTSTTRHDPSGDFISKVKSYNSTYPAELRERAVRLYRETTPKPTVASVASVASVARKLGVGVESLRGWIKQDEADRGERSDRPTTEEREVVRQLRREVEDLKRVNEILRLASSFFASELCAT